jgi:transcriptional regulator with XRE-family HTH domain
MDESMTSQALRKFGKRLKEARENLGFSQVYVSSSLGYSTETYISNVENGVKLLSHKKLNIVAKTLQIPIQELIELSMNVHRAKYVDTLLGVRVDEIV